MESDIPPKKRKRSRVVQALVDQEQTIEEIEERVDAEAQEAVEE